MPRIGITTTPIVHDHRALESIDRPYIDAVLRAGGVPLVLPVLPPAAVHQVLAGLDGLLLSGGGDVDPGCYRADPHPAVAGVDGARDAFELALARAAVVADVPILGICRGAQVLNVAMAGTLVQHLPDVTGQTHRDSDRSAQPVHPVRLDPGSSLAAAVGRCDLAVNTLHHQAVAVPGSGLRAVAWAEDGTIEGVEGVAGQRVLGVQWHPELLPTEPGHPEVFVWLVRQSAGAGAAASSEGPARPMADAAA